MASAFFFVSVSAARYSSTRRFSIAVTRMEVAVEPVLGAEVFGAVFGMASSSDFWVTPHARAISFTTC